MAKKSAARKPVKDKRAKAAAKAKKPTRRQAGAAAPPKKQLAAGSAKKKRPAAPEPQAEHASNIPLLDKSAGRQKKFVIEGVLPLETGLSAVGALYSALQTLGSPIAYDTLSVASGETFRLFVQLPRAMAAGGRSPDVPSAGVAIAAATFATENLLQTACDALGLQARIVCLDTAPSPTRHSEIWRDIERTIRAGRPVPACGLPGSFQHEWCLITGIDEERNRVFFRDVTHRFELYGNGPRGSTWQGWLPGGPQPCWMPHVIIESVPKRPPDEERLANKAVERAIAAARQGFVAPHWAAGLAAYDAWILQLGQARWHAATAERLGEPAMANSWLLTNTFAGRRAAGQFLECTSRFFAGKKNAAVHRAARLYSAAAGALQTAGALFPNWGTGYDDAERRVKAAELLAIAQSAEREATDVLADAFTGK
jgi:hypothetical protein